MSEQLSFALKGSKRGAIAAQSAADAAERRSPGWMDAAFEAFVAFARLSGSTPFVTDDVRKAAGSQVPPPPDGRAWGAVALRAKREGIVTSCGYRKVDSQNGCPKTLWVLAKTF